MVFLSSHYPLLHILVLSSFRCYSSSSRIDSTHPFLLSYFISLLFTPSVCLPFPIHLTSSVLLSLPLVNSPEKSQSYSPSLTFILSLPFSPSSCPPISYITQELASTSSSFPCTDKLPGKPPYIHASSFLRLEHLRRMHQDTSRTLFLSCFVLELVCLESLVFFDLPLFFYLIFDSSFASIAFLLLLYFPLLSFHPFPVPHFLISILSSLLRFFFLPLSLISLFSLVLLPHLRLILFPFSSPHSSSFSSITLIFPLSSFLCHSLSLSLPYSSSSFHILLIFLPHVLPSLLSLTPSSYFFSLCTLFLYSLLPLRHIFTS